MINYIMGDGLNRKNTMKITLLQTVISSFLIVFSFCSVADHPSTKKRIEHPEAQSSDFSPSEDSTGLKHSSGKQEAAQENKPKTSKIERAVMPFTQWIEEKIQNTSIIQPSAYHKKEAADNTLQITLREAIELAQQQFNGTVLSAERVIENHHSFYRIKILSKKGVVKFINIDDQLSTEHSLESK